MTHVPTGISETVQRVQVKAADQVIAAVEKVDSYACSGIDQLTEKVPQLKDATPKLIEETKSAGTSLAKKIEDCTIPESLMEVSGVQSVMERLGLVGGEVKKDVTEEAKEESAQEKKAVE